MAGDITEYRLPRRHSGPAAIARGPDDHLWISEVTGNRIRRIAVP